MIRRLLFGVLLVGSVGPALAQSTGPLAVEERSSSRSASSAAAVPAEGVMLLMQQLQQYEEELAMLRGQVEELRRDLETMRQAERERFLDLDTRINALAASSGPAATPSAGPAGAPESAPPGEALDADRDAYMAARQKLMAQDFSGAAKSFEQYLKAHPQGQFRDFAHFWLGEIYRGQASPDRGKAMEHFKAVIDRHPQSSKVSSALYKLAVLEYESGDLTRARVTLNKVIKQFPESSEAALARSMLEQLK